MKRYLDWIKNRIWQISHKRWTKQLRTRFHGETPTILSCNCTGGILYHDLGLQFTSPTINLYMSSADFIQFIENLEYYLTLSITPYYGDIVRDYPLGTLGDLTLFLVHYQSVEEANQKWQIRKKRMDMNNIFILATDRDGFTHELLNRFNALPYRKRIFTHIPVDSQDCVYIRGFEDLIEVGNLMDPIPGGRRVIDQFDWVGWLNGEI